MKKEFQSNLYNCFSQLIERYHLYKLSELSEEGAYSIEYASTLFVIRLDKYFQEFYVSVYKIGYPTDKVNLFNLLGYLNRTSSNVYKSKYFPEESDLNERYRKQFEYIVDTIDKNFSSLEVFFNREDLALEMAKIETFMVNKYPNLFKKS